MRFCILICCLGLSSIQFAQHVRISIPNPDAATLRTLAEAGIDLQCSSRTTSRGDQPALEIECDRNELLELSNAQIQHTVLIEDLETFYANRASKTLEIARSQLHEERRTRQQGLVCDELAFNVPEHFHLGDMGGFLYYEEILEALDSMALLYPELVTARSPLSDTLKTIQGRDVYWVRISDHPDQEEGEPEVLYTALTHAREPASAMSMLFYMWYLLENYDSDPEIRRIVDHTALYFIPVVNPDGYFYNQIEFPEGGGMWRKNMHDNDTSGTIDLHDGVDLNRNYGYLWGIDDEGSSPTPHKSTYRGTGPFSEPEVCMVRDFVLSRNFTVAMHDHSHGDDLYHAWGHGQSPLPDADILYRISDLMAWHNRYLFGELHKTYWLGSVNGGANDWFYGDQKSKPKILSWVSEIGPVFWPDPTEIVTICMQQMEPHLMAARVAGQYAKIHDLSPPTVDRGSNTVVFRIENLGLVGGERSIEVVPSGQGITQIDIRSGGVIAFDETLESAEVVIDMEIDPRLPDNGTIAFEIRVLGSQGEIAKLFVRKGIGGITTTPGTEAWESETWDTCVVPEMPGVTCFTDSPQGLQVEYQSEIKLVTPLDLEHVSWATVTFLTRWSIETTKDFAQLQVRSGGSSWAPLCGKYSKPGAPGSQLELPSPHAAQPAGEPLFDGRQTQWVREEFDLAPWVGLSSVELRFTTWSGKAITIDQEDGFSFADFRVQTSRNIHCNDQLQNADEEGVDCGGTDCAPCPTCQDMILNGDEEDVDCGGGACIPCPTCTDGIINGNETGVDCGGDCAECIPTCSDGMMNGDETGVDCGGDCPLPCKTRCCERENKIYYAGDDLGFLLTPNPASSFITLEIDTDKLAEDNITASPENNYQIFDVTGKRWLAGNLQAERSTEIAIKGIPDQLYIVRISDHTGRRQMIPFIKAGGL